MGINLGTKLKPLIESMIWFCGSSRDPLGLSYSPAGFAVLIAVCTMGRR
jgi:hypothetical protein